MVRVKRRKEPPQLEPKQDLLSKDEPPGLPQRADVDERKKSVDSHPETDPGKIKDEEKSNAEQTLDKRNEEDIPEIIPNAEGDETKSPHSNNNNNVAESRKESVIAEEVGEDEKLMSSSVWEVHHDDQGTIFYWNTETEEAQWEIPEELANKDVLAMVQLGAVAEDEGQAPEVEEGADDEDRLFEDKEDETRRHSDGSDELAEDKPGEADGKLGTAGRRSPSASSLGRREAKDDSPGRREAADGFQPPDGPIQLGGLPGEGEEEEGTQYSDSEERRVAEEFDDLLDVLPEELVYEIGEARLLNFWKTFNKIDRDRSGLLDLAEVAELINTVTGAEPPPSADAAAAPPPDGEGGGAAEPGGGEGGAGPPPEPGSGPGAEGAAGPRWMAAGDEKLRQLFEEADADGSGALDFVEALEVFKLLFGGHHEGKFLEAVAGVPAEVVGFFGDKEIRELHAYFDRIDTDGSGQLDMTELRELVMMVSKSNKPPSNKKMKKLIKEADKDRDGTIDFCEFLKIYKLMKEGKKTELGKALEASRGVLMVANIGKGIADDFVKYKTHFTNWLNAEEIEEEKKRQRRLERARQKKEEQERRDREDEDFYQEYLREQERKKEERERPVEGLEIEMLYPGDNRTWPEEGDTCTVHYTGHLNGRQFVSTREVGRGVPLAFTLGGNDVVLGWELALRKLCVGCKARVTVSPALCYGRRGLPPLVPPGAELEFVVDLLRVDTNDEESEGEEGEEDDEEEGGGGDEKKEEGAGGRGVEKK